MKYEFIIDQSVHFRKIVVVKAKSLKKAYLKAEEINETSDLSDEGDTYFMSDSEVSLNKIVE